MPDRTEIISAATRIEAALRNAYQTEGRMFGEIIDEIYAKVPRHVVDALREVSAMRNKYAHLPDQEIVRLQSEPSFFEKKASFLRSVDLVDRFLQSGDAGRRLMLDFTLAQSQSSQVSKANKSGGVMFSEWIIQQPISSMPILVKKPLHRDCFVVFTKNRAPHSVAPVSQGFVVAQAAGFFCDGALGIAKEVTFAGEISNELVSSDGVPVRASFHLKFVTDASREESLLKIARESNRILSELESLVIGEFRRFMSSTSFDELTDQNCLVSHEKKMLDNLRSMTGAVEGLKLERLTITELQSGNPAVKSQAQMEFEKRRRLIDEEETERLRNIQIAQEQQMREIGHDAKLSDARISAAIMETRAEAIRKAGEYSLSQEQIFELFKERIHRDIVEINADARVEVAKQKKGEWVALGAMRMLDKMSLGDSRVRLYQEQDAQDDYEEPEDDREGF